MAMDATPPPPATTPDERTWFMLCHLSALCGYFFPFGNLIGPFLIWQIKKNDYPAIEAQAKAMLNFQFTIYLAVIVACILIIVVVGIPLLWAIGAFNVVCIIIAAMKANNGEPWMFPLSIRFLK